MSERDEHLLARQEAADAPVPHRLRSRQIEPA